MASILRKIRKNVCRRENPRAPEQHWWEVWSQNPKAIRRRKLLAYQAKERQCPA